ncbi:hypothetical protein AMTRI_Chr06g196590 [Amborella trichopoda]
MSGHLLLGVVRIYSKKVEYLYHDCHEALNKLKDSFVLMQLNRLPEAPTAPFHSITLPEKFELDLLNLEEMGYQMTELEGDHTKTRDQITLRDQFPCGGDPFMTFSVHEANTCSQMLGINISLQGYEYFSHHNMGTYEVDSGSDLDSFIPKHDGNRLRLEEYPDSEMPRNVDELLNSGIHAMQSNELCKDANEQVDHGRNVILPETLLPSPERTCVSSGFSPSSLQMPVVGTPAGTPKSVVPPAFGEFTPEYMVLPTPKAQERTPKSRKRKHFFDESIVLSNEHMRQRLQDASNLLRKRRKPPLTAFNIWQAYRVSHMHQLLMESWVPSICLDIRAIINESCDLPSKGKRKLEFPESKEHSGSAIGPEVEHWTDHTNIHQSKLSHSHIREEESMPVIVEEERVHKQQPCKAFDGEIEDQRKAESGASQFKTQSTDATATEQQLPAEELSLNLEDEDLNSSVAESRSTVDAGFASVSSRTRVVAQYLRSAFQSWKRGPKEVLSLNDTLEGKTRRECAKMFFEILVLKSSGCVNVQQESSFGDILLFATSALTAV